jgi:mannobiose 2-epimerase
MDIIKPFITSLDRELRSNILPFWTRRMIDHENGGFFGRMDGYGNIHKDSPKGAVLNGRILWTFCNAYNHFGENEYKEAAEKSMQYIKNHFIDYDLGGVFWTVDPTGKPAETKKQIYAIAFILYGLASYYRVFRDKSARDLAIQLFDAIEDHSYDPAFDGYFEAYDREWNLLSDQRLSEKDSNEKKTMNTHLHILEAYTLLYMVLPNNKLARRLAGLIDLFLDRIIQSTYHFGLFFNDSWELRSRKVSFGHDIEASWLLCEAADVLDNAPLRQRVRKVALEIVDMTLREGFDHDGALLNERDEEGRLDSDKHWWPQAEAMIGLVNAYEMTGYDSYLEKAWQVWQFTKNKIVDPINGEWFFRVNREGWPYEKEDKAGLWKCPYHNSRACLEIIRRMGGSAAT